jgi:hypothetical protein
MASSQARRCQGSRGGARAGKRARTGGAERTSPEVRSTDFHPTGSKRLRFLQREVRKFHFKSTRVNGPVLDRALWSPTTGKTKARAKYSLPLGAKLAAEINRVIPCWIFYP